MTKSKRMAFNVITLGAIFPVIFTETARNGANMNKIYGLPYMGSKGRFVEDFFNIIPQKKRFYDLFHGGLAVTHYALLHTGMEVISNDLNKQIQDLFINAVNGDYKNRNEFVSRETFFAEKENDPFIKYAWSFSYKGEGYLYAKEIEGF